MDAGTIKNMDKSETQNSLGFALANSSYGINKYNPTQTMDTNKTFLMDDSNTSLFDDFVAPNFMPTDEMAAIIRKSFSNHSNPVVIVLLILYILSFVWGFLGNILVIHVFTRTRKMRTVTNVFLVNLAICDLMVVCMCMPFNAAQAIYTDWIYGDAWCKLMNYFQGLSITSSILTLTVISAERFYAIKHPLKARSFMTRDRVVKIIVTIWLVSALVVGPALIVRKEQKLLVVIIYLRQCVENWVSTSLKHAYNFCLLLLLYLCPIVFICIGYLRIGTDLWRTDSALFASRDAAKSGNAVRNLSARRKVAKMLFVMALLFALSWLPFNALLVTIDFLPPQFIDTHGQLVRHIFDYSLWLGNANSSVNPICYCIMSQSFKHAFNQEFKRCCRRHRFQRGTSCSSQSNSVTLTTATNVPRSKQTSCAFKNTPNGYKLVCLSRENTDKITSIAEQSVMPKPVLTNNVTSNAPRCMLDIAPTDGKKDTLADNDPSLQPNMRTESV